MKKTTRIISFILSVIICLSAFAGMEAFAETVSQSGITYTDIGGELIATGIDADVVKGDITVPSQVQGKPVTAIGDSVFNSPLITSVVIPNSVQSVGKYAFLNASGLKSVTFMQGTGNVTIGIQAFKGCIALETVVLPETLKKIPSSCFEGCTAIKSITVPASVTIIEANAFYNCISAVSYEVGEGSTSFKSDKGTLYTYDGKELIQYPCGSTDKIFKAPDGLKKIRAGALSYAPLTAVILCDGLQIIDSYAFYRCSKLASINLPSSLTTINDSAFSYCSSLKSVTVPASLVNYENGFSYSGIRTLGFEDGVTSIPLNAFQRCQSLETVVLPDGMTTIENGAFFACKALKNCHIPASVTTIDNMAFGQVTGLTICSETSGTYAEQYATEKGFDFLLCNQTDVGHSSADYSAVDAALAAVPDDLSTYSDESISALSNAISSVNRNLSADDQSTVDGYAEGIRNAVAALEIKSFKASYYVDNALKAEYSIKLGETVTKPADPEKSGYKFVGWNPNVPDKMPANDLQFTAVFERIEVSVDIKNYVSKRSESYRTTITFTAVTEKTPDGASIKWYVDGREAGTGDTYTVSKAENSYTIQAKIVSGNEVIGESRIETVEISTNFFAKLIAFFRSLFNKLPVITQ